MLFHADRHEPLCATPWTEAAAHTALRDIVDDIERHRGSDGQWPMHPLDDGDPMPKAGYKSLYLGSAGVLWALAWLRRERAVDVSLDVDAAMQHVHAAYLADPDTGEAVPSYLLGEVGILLMQWRQGGGSSVADRLFAQVQGNIANPTNESLWAAPGTMVAAWHLWVATGDTRWRELFLQNVEQVWRTWLDDDKVGCHLWTQDMYGKVVQYYGAGHGFVGNLYPLLKGAALLDEQRREQLWTRCEQAVRVTAREEEGAVNWPPGSYTPRPDGPKMLLQWCHGAPGFITALVDFPAGRSAELDALLVGGGEATWRAGPLVKGYGLCHGTAGNGCAFLALYRRTGDEAWLARARGFAMHALQQREHMRQTHAQGRYTLWTGDAGLAVYLWQCITGQAGMAGLDIV